jgi:hypothetical protein
MSERSEEYFKTVDDLTERVLEGGPAMVRKAALSAFSNVSKEHPLLKAIQLLLTNQIRIEHLALGQTGLSDSLVRQQLGRQMALEDFRAVLLQVHDKGITVAK